MESRLCGNPVFEVKYYIQLGYLHLKSKFSQRTHLSETIAGRGDPEQVNIGLRQGLYPA